jgi:para-nitrobenzyl esterase
MSEVETATGRLRGREADGVHAFKGVPYAEPLTGLARWLPPRPRTPWTGTREAMDYGPACQQFGAARSRWSPPTPRQRYLAALGGLQRLEQGDDCLLLNVWSPSLDRNARLPVMVWIHGGGFSGGGANGMYDGSVFARQGVVCVAIQYRLGPPGFLHGGGLFDGEICADNRAFQDQLCALRWVRENIAAFGGDPDAVTLFGQSAGAFAIFQLVASPQGRGLFRRAIAIGGMPGTCAPAEDYRRLSRDALADVGVRAGDSAALSLLDTAQQRRLQAAVTRRAFGRKYRHRYGQLGRERVSYLGAATGTPFLPKPPLAALAEGTPNDVDLLLGTCAQDGSLFSQILPFGRGLSARLFAGTLSGLAPGGDLAALKARYARVLPRAGATRLHEQINNDAFYRMPTLRAAEAHAAAHPGRTWHYQLDYPSAIPTLGAIHAIDVALLFRTAPVAALLGADDAGLQLSEQLRGAMIRFARTGRPSADGLPDWPPYDRSTRATLVFDTRCRLEHDLDAPLRLCWEPA